MLSRGCGARGDHPRSRGVYTGGDGFEWGVDGSSPLARGLRKREGVDVHLVGIIPARAGFTQTLSATAADARDHPRSRGVYSPIYEICVLPVGSSPLARGLLASGNGLVDHTGIIPARAGFTSGCAPPWRGPRDHPRSRGVYGDAGSYGGVGCGSSPLARGLHVRYNLSSKTRRIIPARAGFTEYRRDGIV